MKSEERGGFRVEERTIGGFRYKMEQLGTSSGNQVVLRLGGPIAALMSEAVGRGHARPTKGDIVAGFERAVVALKPRDLAYVVKKLASKTEVWLPDGKTAPKLWPLADHFEHHFAGRYEFELQWIRWGIELNRFFGSALALIFESAGEPKSDSLQGSTDGNGVSSAAGNA